MPYIETHTAYIYILNIFMQIQYVKKTNIHTNKNNRWNWAIRGREVEQQITQNDQKGNRYFKQILKR